MMHALLILLVFTLTLTRAWGGAGTTAAGFLQENLNARLVGIAGIYAPLARGSEALLTNPAGVVLSGNAEVNASYSASQNQSRHTMLIYTHPLSLRGYAASLGGAINFYSAGRMDIFDSNGPTRSINSEDAFEAALHIGVKPLPYFSLGVSPKFIRSKLVEQYTASGYGVDLGAMVYPVPSFGDRLVVGAAVQNLGTKLQYRDAKSDLPRTESFGLSITPWEDSRWGSLLLATQGDRSVGEKMRYRMGFEYQYGFNEARAVFLRGGAQMHSDEDISIGIGFRERRLSFDYAFVGSADLEKTHRITLIYRFGSPTWNVKSEQEPPMIYEREERKPEPFDLFKAEEELKKKQKLKEKNPKNEGEFYMIEEDNEKQKKMEGEQDYE